MSEELTSLRRYLESHALTAKARGRDDRDWLDALILLEKAEAADRDAAAVEARVRDVLSDIEYERSFGAVLAHQRFGEGFHAGLDYATQRLRAALSGPADAHPADGTGA